MSSDEQFAIGPAEHSDRRLIWEAIVSASEHLTRRGVDVHLGTEYEPEIGEISRPPDRLATWRLIEVLSALAVLARADRIETSQVTGLDSVAGPFAYARLGRQRWLWVQRTMKGETSGLGARPDIVLTSTPEKPTKANAVQIVEVKTGRTIGAPTLRAEFGKARDLEVRAYLIWSYAEPKPREVEAARSLGLDLRQIDLTLTDPHQLLFAVGEAIEQSEARSSFAIRLAQSAQNAMSKLDR
ncbi:MAG: hypothetical protein AB7T37_02505 [Dehalococcoidia bacterium]